MLTQKKKIEETFILFGLYLFIFIWLLSISKSDKLFPFAFFLLSYNLLFFLWEVIWFVPGMYNMIYNWWFVSSFLKERYRGINITVLLVNIPTNVNMSIYCQYVNMLKCQYVKMSIYQYVYICLIYIQYFQWR